MRFNGFHNLLDNVEAIKPISIENFYKKSVFSRKKLVEVVFSLDTSGCLSGESIPFILYVKNPKCIPLQTTVQIILQVKFDATGKRDAPKKRYAVVALKEKQDLEPQPELIWVNNLLIGENQEPSYAGHFMYSVTYCIQVLALVMSYYSSKFKHTYMYVCNIPL